MMILIVFASLSCAFAVTSTSLTIGDALPVLSNISVITNISLSGSGNTSFWCNATVTDNNGNSDVVKVNSTFWNPAGANESSNNSVSYHYTNSTCRLVVATNLSKQSYCYFSLSNDTVLGNWSCKINAFDHSGNVSNTTTVHVYQCGDDDCNYGETCSTCEIDCGVCGTQQDTSGGSSSGYVIPKSYYLLESTGTFEKTVVVGDNISFDVGTSSHNIRITALTSDSITLEISSTPIKVFILIGETKFFYLDGDGWYDISIYLKEITAGKAHLAIETFAKKLVETAVQETAPTTIEPMPVANAETPSVSGETKTSSSGTVPLQSGLLSIIIIMALVVGFYVKTLIHKHRRHRR
jgi:hypothetical protein